MNASHDYERVLDIEASLTTCRSDPSDAPGTSPMSRSGLRCCA